MPITPPPSRGGGVAGALRPALRRRDRRVQRPARRPPVRPGWFQMQPTTARKSAPARTSGAQFSGVMPPMAQHGSSIISDHHAQDFRIEQVRHLLRAWTERTRRTRRNPRRPRRPASPGRGCPCRSRPSVRSGPISARAWRAGMSSCPTCTPSQPVGTHQIGAVVQQERHVARLRHRPQHVDRPPPRIVIDVLQPQLHRRHVAGVQRGAPGGRRTRPAPAPAG